jgi:ethanolamine utilization protein EutQ (cupin superfamily)
MASFPAFMKSPANLIASGSQNTPDIEGYVFDGAEGSQMAFWECRANATTVEHVHAFDEYFIVVEGSYIIVLDGEEVRLDAGQEYFIPRGTRIAGRVTAGTRTIHMFGGHRAERHAAASPSTAANSLT